MNKIYLFLFSIFLIFIGCQEPKPQISQKEKIKTVEIKTPIKLIESQINQELEEIKQKQAKLEAKEFEQEQTIKFQADFKTKKDYSFFANWTKPDFEQSYSKQPFKSVSNLTQKYIDTFVRFNPFDISYIPAKIKKPALPPVVNLTRGKYEKTVEFELRVEKAMNKRDNELFAIQKKYRAEVEERNKLISILKKMNEKTSHKNKTVFIDEVQSELTQIALNKVMSNFKLVPKDYNPDSEVYLAQIKSTNSNYSKDVVFKNISPRKAKSMDSNPENYTPKVSFKISQNSISLEKIKLNGSFASLNDEFKKPEKLSFAVKNIDPKFDKIQKELVVQSANLPDYQSEKAVFVENSFRDDLPKLLKNKKQVKLDPTKWAFVIGVEKYKDTYDVPFSKRSSELFSQVLEKSLGIPKRNIYSLIDSEATSSRIKDKLELMISNVKDGDTIYLYYSGHGVPDAKTEKAYILPTDKIVDFVYKDKNLQLDNIYKKLTQSKAKKVVAFIDACFSGKTGAKKNDSLFAGTGTGAGAIVVRQEFDKNRMVVLTAGGNKDFSNMFKEKGHRLFSYFLMKEILNSKSADLKVELIHNAVQTKVREISNQIGDQYEQTPQIYGNRNISLN